MRNGHPNMNSEKMENSASYHPGPPEVQPEERLLLMGAPDWEIFIDECVRQLQKEGEYVQVHHLGGAGDKGRDVCGYTLMHPDEDTWDLYQAKHYAGTLSPSSFAGELAKFLFSVYSGAYKRPRTYHICALKVGVSLLDLVLNPERMRVWILKEWKNKNGDFSGYKQKLTAELEVFVNKFPFEILRVTPPAVLLDIHRRTPAHWSKFGVLDKRKPNPTVPVELGIDEMNYIFALLQLYSEHAGINIDDPDTIPKALLAHFKVQRRLFFCAEGLNRFSRDKLPGAFEELLDQIELGVGTTLTSPHVSGMQRLKETLGVANSLPVSANPLSARLQAGDLQGGCHHLANQERITWIDSDE